MFVAFIVESLAKLLFFMYVLHVRIVRVRRFSNRHILLASIVLIGSIFFGVNRWLYYRTEIEIVLPTIFLENSVDKEYIKNNKPISRESATSIIQEGIKNVWVVGSGQNFGGILNNI